MSAATNARAGTVATMVGLGLALVVAALGVWLWPALPQADDFHAFLFWASGISLVNAWLPCIISWRLRTEMRPLSFLVSGALVGLFAALCCLRFTGVPEVAALATCYSVMVGAAQSLALWASTRMFRI